MTDNAIHNIKEELSGNIFNIINQAQPCSKIMMIT